MLATRNALQRHSSSLPYVCLHCRLRVQQQKRRRVHHASSTGTEHVTRTIQPQSISGDAYVREQDKIPDTAIQMSQENEKEPDGSQSIKQAMLGGGVRKRGRPQLFRGALLGRANLGYDAMDLEQEVPQRLRLRALEARQKVGVLQASATVEDLDELFLREHSLESAHVVNRKLRIEWHKRLARAMRSRGVDGTSNVELEVKDGRSTPELDSATLLSDARLATDALSAKLQGLSEVNAIRKKRAPAHYVALMACKQNGILGSEAKPADLAQLFRRQHGLPDGNELNATAFQRWCRRLGRLTKPTAKAAHTDSGRIHEETVTEATQSVKTPIIRNYAYYAPRISRFFPKRKNTARVPLETSISNSSKKSTQPRLTSYGIKGDEVRKQMPPDSKNREIMLTKEYLDRITAPEMLGVRRHWGTPWDAKQREQEALQHERARLEAVMGDHTDRAGLKKEEKRAPRQSHLTTWDREPAMSEMPETLDAKAIEEKFGRHTTFNTPNAAVSAPTSSVSSFSRMAWQDVAFSGLSRRGRGGIRAYHTSRPAAQHTAAAQVIEPEEDILDAGAKPDFPKNGIRAQLRQWQELHPNEPIREMEVPQDPDTGAPMNNLTRLGDIDALRQPAAEEEEERHAMEQYAAANAETLEHTDIDRRFLKMGDLVELQFPRSERESLIAVFVRRLGFESQFFTMQGKWAHLPERSVQYSIPGWISPKMVEPMIQYLPREDELGDELKDRAYTQDLSVPRSVSAPIVAKLLQFDTESQDIYRKHASTLDNAHNILAHETDLRYGSLVSAATRLLGIPGDKLPLTALFTVRKALMHGGFAFNSDVRSHRLTGYLQIRSREQVRNLETVRNWLRQWQEENAMRAVLDEREMAKRKTPKGAKNVQNFINKARQVVLKSRETREPTNMGNIGPSKVVIPITEGQDAIRMEKDDSFTLEDLELVKFLEAWCCSNMFLGLPRVESLPPLILAATGLYESYELSSATGFVFLQELGTLLPYENRVRFDQHLLLPSSQHSKPLQNLMTSLIGMQTNHDLSDSMKDLRRDWKGLPVFCIDDPSAHEIDDGLSIEKAGEGEYWAHIHIANPTAFFSRDHPLAKMARHMGESIYMPERAYMMLPGWVTQEHFSLAKDRPCLTFSARMNEEGEVLERKITPGIIRNVMRLTSQETSRIVGIEVDEQPGTILTVGGDPPPMPKRKTMAGSVTSAQANDLRTMQRLAERRQAIRRAQGGVFFNSHRPEVNVWQRWGKPGLGWDHPYRKGARRVEGDPVIQMRAQGLVNWFAANNDTKEILVQEMMLLACEIATAWCAERAIPTIYRGTVKKPDTIDSKRYFEETLSPAAAKNGGEYPLHLGIEYVRTIGSTILTTKPLKHTVLGLDHYGKVTSPLRRYGDMILHWQIEAALREEAATGRSLVTSERKPNRSFLPFSAPVLETIMTGLQPREAMIQRASLYAENFWVAQVLFRAFYFGQAALPKTFNGYIYSPPHAMFGTVAIIVKEYSFGAQMIRPGYYGTDDLGDIKAGDTWECVLDRVDAFKRTAFFRPVRLVDRWE